MKKFTIYIIGLILTSTVIICPIIYVYKLNVDLKENEYQSFVIKGTKKILIVKSKAHILGELNKK